MKKKFQTTEKRGQLAILLTRKTFNILIEQGVNPQMCHELSENEVIVMMSTDVLHRLICIMDQHGFGRVDEAIRLMCVIEGGN